MNREAVALGTPVATTFAGRIGAVDEQLLAEGRLRLLTSADDLAPAKRTATAATADARPGSDARHAPDGARRRLRWVVGGPAHAGPPTVSGYGSTTGQPAPVQTIRLWMLGAIVAAGAAAM